MAEATVEVDKEERIQKLFRMSRKESDELDGVVELAYQLQLIKNQTFQDFMQFALNCAHEWVKREYLRRRGMAVK